MRHQIILLFSLFSLNLYAADYSQNKVRTYPANQLTESTYVITGPRGYPSVENQGFMNNPAFIVTEQGVIVIDPGSSVQAGRMVLDQIQKITSKPVTHVFNTHVHGDHWLGNHAIHEQYPKAILIGHPEMIRRANDRDAVVWLNFMSRVTEGFTDGTEAHIPTKAVTDSETVSLNGITINIYAPGSAHSGSDIMIEFVEESVLFTGDNVLYTRIARMGDGTFKGNINACDKAIAINSQYYVPGHGPSGGVEVVKAYRDYLSTLYKSVAKYYQQEMADYEMKPNVVADLSQYNDWVNFEDEVGRHISQALLEIEQSEF